MNVFSFTNVSEKMKDRLVEEGFTFIERENISQAHILITNEDTPITTDTLNQCPELRVIITMNVGTDHIDLQECERRTIRVYNAPGSNASAVASHVIGLMLGVMRKIPYADRHVRQGGWERQQFYTYELSGSTVGLIGFGAIGKLVAKKLQGFDTRFLIYDPPLSKQDVENHPSVKNRCKKVETLEELLKESDVVSVHVPLLPQTKNLIDVEQLHLMKPTSILINTSRGGIINEEALIKALKEKKILGAGLDVFESEPLGRSEFFSLENVILTPHIAANTFAARAQMENDSITSFLIDKNNGEYD